MENSTVLKHRRTGYREQLRGKAKYRVGVCCTSLFLYNDK